MFSFHVGVTFTVSSFPFAVLVNINITSSALLCSFPPSTHVFVPLISTSFGSVIVFVILFPSYFGSSYPFTCVSITLYVYTYPSSSYLSNPLNVYVAPSHVGVSFKISVFPFAILVNVNLTSSALSCSFPPSTHVFVPLTSTSAGSAIVFVILFPSYSGSSYPFTCASVTLYVYSYPSASYLSNPLNVYVFPSHVGVTFTVSSFPFAVLVNVNLTSSALLCAISPSTHVFVPLITTSAGSVIVFVMLFPSYSGSSYPFTLVSVTLYVYSNPSASYVGNLLNVYVAPSHVGVTFTISVFPFAILVNVNLTSSALLCVLPPSTHVFVPLTLVSGFTGTLSSSSSSLGPSGTVTVATLYIFSKFAVSFSVTV